MKYFIYKLLTTLSLKQRSTATIEVVDLPEINISRTVKAIINVFDALNFTVDLLIRGRSYNFPGKNKAYRKREFLPRSLTLIYEHKSRQTRNRYVHIGSRQPGDVLLYKVSKEVTTTSRYAATDFLYENSEQFISSVDFSFDVSVFAILLIGRLLQGKIVYTSAAALA